MNYMHGADGKPCSSYPVLVTGQNVYVKEYFMFNFFHVASYKYFRKIIFECCSTEKYIFATKKIAKELIDFILQ